MKAMLGGLIGFGLALFTCIPLMRWLAITETADALLFGMGLGCMFAAAGRVIGKLFDK